MPKNIFRIPFLYSLPLFLLFFSCASNAAVYQWYHVVETYRTYTTAAAACASLGTVYPSYPDTSISRHTTYKSPTELQCQIKGQPSGNNIVLALFARSGDSCATGKVWDTVSGSCITPVNPCTAKLGQATTWRKEYPNQAAYDANPIREVASQGGCGVTVGTLECGTSGSTGKFGCWGTGTYSGNQQAESDGSGVADCGATCKAPEPTTTNNSKSCTAPAVNNGTISYTCTTESNADQFSSSNCSIGTVNGVTGLHCTKPDYVPESDKKTVQDKITETPKTPAGTGSTVVKESTVTSTKCKQGVCTTTTTTTTTTTGKDGTGAVTDEGTACTGDKCDNPATPQDESKEEEGTERTVSGESCASNLSCDGDAIDCAILKQQKDMACSLDWETQKGQVLAEAAKPEYKLKTAEFDAGSLFSGPSASRWLGSSCPADRTIHLETTGRSIAISWSPVCDYASIMGYLFVFSASLFFAHYVGRAFGGD